MKVRFYKITFLGNWSANVIAKTEIKALALARAWIDGGGCPTPKTIPIVEIESNRIDAVQAPWGKH